MKEVDCCYNCKHFCKANYFDDVWVCLAKKADTNIFHDFEKVKPNNICEKWEHK